MSSAGEMKRAAVHDMEADTCVMKPGLLPLLSDLSGIKNLGAFLEHSEKKVLHETCASLRDDYKDDLHCDMGAMFFFDPSFFHAYAQRWRVKSLKIDDLYDLETAVYPIAFHITPTLESLVLEENATPPRTARDFIMACRNNLRVLHVNASLAAPVGFWPPFFGDRFSKLTTLHLGLSYATTQQVDTWIEEVAHAAERGRLPELRDLALSRFSLEGFRRLAQALDPGQLTTLIIDQPSIPADERTFVMVDLKAYLRRATSLEKLRLQDMPGCQLIDKQWYTEALAPGVRDLYLGPVIPAICLPSLPRDLRVLSVDGVGWTDELENIGTLRSLEELTFSGDFDDTDIPSLVERLCEERAMPSHFELDCLLDEDNLIQVLLSIERYPALTSLTLYVEGLSYLSALIVVEWLGGKPGFVLRLIGDHTEDIKMLNDVFVSR